LFVLPQNAKAKEHSNKNITDLHSVFYHIRSEKKLLNSSRLTIYEYTVYNTTNTRSNKDRQ